MASAGLQDTIYIGNLPFGVNKNDLQDMFSECGTIVEAIVATGEKGRSKGFGTVKFLTSQEAAYAISEYNGADLEGRIIEVRYDKGPKTKAAASTFIKSSPLKASAKEFKPANAGAVSVGKSLFVGNLPWSVTWAELEDYLSTAGKVASGEILQDYQGRSKGFAIVSMISPADAKKVIDSLNGVTFEGRELEIRYDKASSKAAEAPVESNTKSEGQRIVIRNLPEGTTWQQLKDLMKAYGPVLRSDVQDRDGVVVGYVVINKSKVNQALAELNGSTVNGNEITVGLDDGTEPTLSSGASIYIGNLPFQVRWQDLKDLFKGEFDPIRADVMMDGPHRSKGFGIVKFSTLEEAERVVQEFQGATLQGRPLVVRLDKFSRD